MKRKRKRLCWCEKCSLEMQLKSLLGKSRKASGYPKYNKDAKMKCGCELCEWHCALYCHHYDYSSGELMPWCGTHKKEVRPRSKSFHEEKKT